MAFSLEDFVRESNRIEGIARDPTSREVLAYEFVLSEPEVTTKLLENFVTAVQPGAVLRDREGLDVRVGDYVAPLGGLKIREMTDQVLERLNSGHGTPFYLHCVYEALHPFTDGNGRSGRALWLRAMGGIERAPLGFLHHFYYQALEYLT